MAQNHRARSPAGNVVVAWLEVEGGDVSTGVTVWDPPGSDRNEKKGEGACGLLLGYAARTGEEKKRKR